MKTEKSTEMKTRARNYFNPLTGVKIVWTKLPNGDLKAECFDREGVKFDQGVQGPSDARRTMADDRKHGFICIPKRDKPGV